MCFISGIIFSFNRRFLLICAFNTARICRASPHRSPASWLCQRIQQHAKWSIVSPSASLRALIPDKIHPSAAAARGDGADNAANGIGDVVVGAGRMVDAVAAGARPSRSRPTIWAMSRSWRGKVMWPELSNGSMSLNRSDLGCLQTS